MKVKVGNTIFDGEIEPVMVILSDQDKQNITNMAEAATRYSCFPENTDKETYLDWMINDDYWHDGPYAEIAEIRVLEGKVKALQVLVKVLRSGAVIPDADAPA